MGWCSGTEIFDSVCSVLLDKKPADKKMVIKQLITSLEDADWDCQHDSAFWDHPLVSECFKEMHPHWFDGK